MYEQILIYVSIISIILSAIYLGIILYQGDIPDSLILPYLILVVNIFLFLGYLLILDYICIIWAFNSYMAVKNLNRVIDSTEDY